jgi:hypothetical protein
MARTDGADTGLIIMPAGEYWDRPAAKCVLRTENGCGDILCAERRYCQRRNRYSISDILIPAEVLSPSAVEAPVLISCSLADLIAKESLREGGFEPAAGSLHRAEPGFTAKVQASAPLPPNEAPTANAEPAAGKKENLVEWIFEQHPRDGTPPKTCAKLMALRDSSLKAHTDKDFRQAFGLVYDTKSGRGCNEKGRPNGGRPRRVGWPLREPYKSRLTERNADPKSL